MKKAIIVTTIVLSFLFVTSCTKAEFNISPLVITPSQIIPGETITVNTDIKNIGNAEGIFTAILTVNGIELESKELEIASGVTAKLSFDINKDTPGNYIIAINDIQTPLTIPSLEDIRTTIVQTMRAENVETYHEDSKIILEITGKVDREDTSVSLGLEAYGIVDVLNRRAWLEGNLSIEATFAGEEFDMEVGIEIYTLGNDEYSLTDFEGETEWTKERLPIGSWGEAYGFDRNIKLLEESEIIFLGSTEIDGIDSYLIIIIPSDEVMLEYVLNDMSQTEETFISEEFMYELLKDTELKIWVSKDFRSIIQQEAVLNTQTSPESFFGSDQGLIDVTMTISSKFSNFGKLVQIDLPAAAAEATEAVSRGSTEAAAAETEFANIQSAVVAMMVDNLISQIPNPQTSPTDDMQIFPDASGKHVLYNYLQNGTYVNYLVSRYTNGTYTVDIQGTVTQVTTGY